MFLAWMKCPLPGARAQVLKVLRAPNIGGHRKLFCRKNMQNLALTVLHMPYWLDRVCAKNAMSFAKGRDPMLFAIGNPGFFSSFRFLETQYRRTPELVL